LHAALVRKSFLDIGEQVRSSNDQMIQKSGYLRGTQLLNWEMESEVALHIVLDRESISNPGEQVRNGNG
jgi:hypothetical protein